MRKTPFEKGYYYHIYNRGTEKRKIFLKNPDYSKFLQQIKKFNFPNNTPEYVEIIALCLMPNHFHFLLIPVVDNGIPLFMQKLGTGYTMYFNKKYERTGVLFQGPYRCILIESESHLLHLTRYIHLNPVELIEPGWKEKGVKNWNKVNKFLEKYPWSSYKDYLDEENLPFPVNKNVLIEEFQSPERYKKFLGEWLNAEHLKSLDIPDL